MSAPAKKPASKKPALRVVEKTDPLAVADAAISELAKVPTVSTSRVIAVRNESTMRLNELNRERVAFEERRSHLTAQYDHAMKALDENVADIDEALAVLTGGLDATPTTGTTAA